MNCINLPPNKLPSAFTSAGKTISLRSDCDSATVLFKVGSFTSTSVTGHLPEDLPTPATTPHHQTMDEAQERIALLTQVLEQNPSDAFARYGLAMAHLAGGHTDIALAEFSTLIHLNPDYVPAYQMSAQTLVKLGRTEEALDRLHHGIAAANRTRNQHALAEMEALREELT